MAAWVYDPHSGGTAVPANIQYTVREQLRKHVQKQGYTAIRELLVRFRSQFCYVDAYIGDETEATHLFRLRYIAIPGHWSLAFYSYGNEKYEPCLYNTGELCGTPQEALDTCSIYFSEL